MHADEHRFLKALTKGDKKGLEWIFEQYKMPVLHYCIKLLRIQDLAEEATADVFIKVWEKRLLIDPKRSLAPFLYKIAKDITYDYLRKVASQDRLRQKFLENYPLVDQKDGEWLFLRKERMAKVMLLLDTLPPQRKLIFKMRYFDGIDNPTIARELNLSIHTVKSQLGKARSFVRQELGGKEYEQII